MSTEPVFIASRWDKVVSILSYPVRLAAWAVALGITLGMLGGVSWVVVAGLGLTTGLGLGEVVGRSRLRTPHGVLLLIGVALAGSIFGWGLTQPAVIPSLVGPAAAFWFSTLVWVGTSVFVLVGGLRFLSLRGPAVAVVELSVIGALLASCVSAHRDGAIARPLWLSDLSWSFGVDPGRVLLVGGALLTLLLASLLLVGSGRRKPSIGFVVVPLLALLAWAVAVSLPALQPPDPDEFLGLGGDEPTDEKGSGSDDSSEKGEDAGGNSGGAGAEPQGGGPGKAGDSSQEASSSTQGPSEGGGAQEGQGGAPSTSSKEGQEGGAAAQAPDPLDGGTGGANNPVAVILVNDDAVPSSGMWYLRQTVLPEFNGSRLVSSTLPDANQDTLDHFPVEPTSLEDVPLDARGVVRGSVSLLVEHDEPFAPSSVVSYAPRGNPNVARFVRSYSFVSYVVTAPFSDLLGRELGNPAWSPELRAQYLEVPPDPRYQQLADDLLFTLPLDRQDDGFLRAAVVTKWIGDNMKYSKSERHAEVDDPTADFLFGNRIGYCVHTAHASVYLWRALGIPSRVATGYAVEEDTRRGSVLIARAGDAHAWPELYITDVGWVALDVVPAENLDATAGAADEDESKLLGEMARNAPEIPGPRPDYTWVWKVLGYTFGGALVGIVTLTIIGLYVVKLWRRARPLWASSAALPRVGYRAALDLLADCGLRRAPGETREDFARRYAATLPALEVLTALHLRGTLGRPPAESPELSRTQWTGLVARLHYELRLTVPWWRRVMGVLDPTTFMRTR